MDCPVCRQDPCYDRYCLLPSCSPRGFANLFPALSCVWFAPAACDERRCDRVPDNAGRREIPQTQKESGRQGAALGPK